VSFNVAKELKNKTEFKEAKNSEDAVHLFSNILF